MTERCISIYIILLYCDIFSVAYPVVHVDWDLPPCDPADASGYATGAQTPLFPPSTDFGWSYNGGNGCKKSSSSDALMQMSADSAFSTMKTNSNTKEKMSFKTQQHFRPMAEDAMGAAVHVQQGEHNKD